MIEVPADLGSDGSATRFRDQRGRPALRTVAIAAGELLIAIVLARLISSPGDMPPPPPRRDSMGMGAGSMSVALEPNWTVVHYSAIAVVVLGLGWWLTRRQAVAAVAAALGLAVLASSEPVRLLAAQSHIVSMAALEVLLVAAPLLVITAIPVSAATGARRLSTLSATAFAVAAGLSYAGLLIVLHMPAVHRTAAHGGAVPLWVAVVALSVGLAYWVGIVCVGDRVSMTVRRSILFGAQEIAAFIGLLSLFGAWGAMGHRDPLGLPTATDQRLGGLLMIIACGAVTIPTARRLSQPPSEEGT